MYPRIHLAIDNCFAKKRWTAPLEWMTIARDCGIYQIEASADTETDPFVTPPEVLAEWRTPVQAASAETGVKVANLFSGYVTYSTLGMLHPDVRVRDHVQHRWLDKVIDQAAAVGAGVGFYCFAFDQATLRDPDRHAAAMNDLYARLAQVASKAQADGLPSISTEQMYAPHQPPWTMRGTLKLLREVYRRGGAPFYITLDSGHAAGQRNFLRPTLDQIDRYYTSWQADAQADDSWYGYLDLQAHTPTSLADAIAARDDLFALPEDCDIYNWLRTLGAYAPVVHLQQTDGTHSGHQPFTKHNNESGIIEPSRVLQAIKDAYDAPEAPGLPPRVQDIYLTFEFFAGTAQRPERIIRDIAESAAYWRQVVAEDGLTVDTLLADQ